ncbi:FAD:protein FMN transferase [Kitasatospora sp. GP82]|uniref:FAD:protein FMN transferase n=1 Tax=Kitasatospora sp. GP82 TaxID=3035089 RepID=UPI0024772BD4|nr:FAD:protein FMN transferase [Kitasatospora sp. GP82]MDH6124029.1 thiamine biosynthesis lipoprotein [Kitasatospora sp. GP82]
MLRHAEPVMGTVFSFAVRDATLADLAPALAELHRLDGIFSTYRPQSDISRLARGELELGQCDPLVAEVLDHCTAVGRETDGYFSARAAGALDPSGWVKGWAVERASRLLTQAGFTHHNVTGGGDVQCTGEPTPGRPWRIGIADPARTGQLAAVVTGRHLAVATSGTAERGPHILDPHTGRPPVGALSLTLVGERLARTDACATAAFAMGPHRALHWAEHRPDVEALVILDDGTRLATPGLGRYLAPGPAGQD